MTNPKILPHSRDAEMGVLGSLLLEPTQFDAVIDLVSSPDFYFQNHRIIFQTMRDLFDRELPIDILTVTDDLKRLNKLEQCGGAAFIAGLPDSVPHASFIAKYAHLVRDKAVLRSLISCCTNIAARAFEEPTEVQAFVDEVEGTIYDVNRRNLPTEVDFRQALLDGYKQIEGISQTGIIGLRTGIEELDRLTYGLLGSELIIISGRPGSGKSAFALTTILFSAFTEKKASGLFSLEMAARELTRRMVLNRAGVILTDSLDTDHWKKINAAFNAIQAQETLFSIDDSAVISPQQIRARARRWKSQKNISLLVIDYLQLVNNHKRGANREQEVADSSRQFKALAKELDIPVIVLSQLSRASEKESREPRLSDLRESGAIEQDADKVIFIYDSENTSWLKLAKHRNGPTGKVEINIHWSTGRFYGKTDSLDWAQSY